jgi:sulfoxide reductase catalytic subunit YedY
MDSDLNREDREMYKRRQFLKLGFGIIAGLSSLFSPLFLAAKWVYAQGRRTILPKNTSRESLINKDPSTLDTRYLELTDLKDFKTMGESDHKVDINTWQLEIKGCVKKPFRLNYQEILELPSIEKDVLLICPGFFANHGRWKGISMPDLFEKTGLSEKARYMTVTGPSGWGDKVERFPIEDVLSKKVFLAYEVNGKTLPIKNGFPLRIVAEGYYGDDWVKYVRKVVFE